MYRKPFLVYISNLKHIIIIFNLMLSNLSIDDHFIMKATQSPTLLPPTHSTSLHFTPPTSPIPSQLSTTNSYNPTSLKRGPFFPYIHHIHPSCLFSMIGPLVLFRGISELEERMVENVNLKITFFVILILAV